MALLAKQADMLVKNGHTEGAHLQQVGEPRVPVGDVPRAAAGLRRLLRVYKLGDDSAQRRQRLVDAAGLL